MKKSAAGWFGTLSLVLCGSGAMLADESSHGVSGVLSSTTLSGYVVHQRIVCPPAPVPEATALPALVTGGAVAGFLLIRRKRR